MIMLYIAKNYSSNHVHLYMYTVMKTKKATINCDLKPSRQHYYNVAR